MSEAAVLQELIKLRRGLGVDEMNEAATRLLFVNRILGEVLGWPLETFNPEDYARDGAEDGEWLDYHLETAEGTRVVVEAKRAGRTFQFAPTRRQRTRSLKALRSSHGGDLGAAVKQALNYCQNTLSYAFIVTNGWQWIASVAFWPNVKPEQVQAVVFHDLEEILENLPDFIELLSPEGLRRDTLVYRCLRDQSLRPPFARSINDSLKHNPPRNKNYLSGPIEAVMRHCFNDLAGESREQLLEYCYVANDLTEGYVARLENFVGHTLPENLRGAQIIDRADFDRRAGSDAFSRAIRSRGEALYLVGRVGSGKSSFLQYALHRLRERFPAGEFVVLHLDLINRTQLRSRQFSHDILRDELSAQLLTQAERVYSDVSPFSYENLKGIFAAEVQREINAMHPDLRGTPTCSARIDALLGELRRASFSHLLRFLDYLVNQRNLAVVVVLDNIDRGTVEFEEFSVLFARRLTEETACTTVTALRDTTYYGGKRGGFLDVSQNVVFSITPPPFLSVASRRIDYTRKRLRSDPNLYARVTRSLAGYPLERVEDFVEVLAELLLGGRSGDINEAIQALAGTNVRLALELLRSFATSGNTDIERLLREYNKDYFGQPLSVFLRSMMLGNHTRYDESTSEVVNLFQVSRDSMSSHFAMIRILQYLGAAAQDARTDTDVPVEATVAAVSSSAGLLNTQVRTALDHLGRYNLVLSRSQPEPPWEPDSSIRISSGGLFYLKRIIFNRDYIAGVVDDTVVYDPNTHDSLLFVHNDKTATWPQRTENKVQLFLRYLWTREHEETTRALGTSASWVQPISLEIATSFFGAEFTNELMRTKRSRR